MSYHILIVNVVRKARVVLRRKESADITPVGCELAVHVHLSENMSDAGAILLKISYQIPHHSTTLFPAFDFNPSLAVSLLCLPHRKIGHLRSQLMQTQSSGDAES